MSAFYFRIILRKRKTNKTHKYHRFHRKYRILIFLSLFFFFLHFTKLYFSILKNLHSIKQITYIHMDVAVQFYRWLRQTYLNIPH